MVAFQHISLWKFRADADKDAKEACLQKLKKVSKPGVLRIHVGEVVEGENESGYTVGLTADLQSAANAPTFLEELLSACKELPLENHTHMAFQCIAAPALKQPPPAKRNFRAMGAAFMPVSKVAATGSDRTAATGSNKFPLGGFTSNENKSEWKERDTSKQIYVSDIPYKANNEDIWSFFADKGFKVARVHIFKTPIGKSKGSCVVDFDGAEEPAKAVELSGAEFKLGGDEDHAARKIKIVRS